MSVVLLDVLQFIFVLNQIAGELETPIVYIRLNLSNVNFAQITKKARRFSVQHIL